MKNFFKAQITLSTILLVFLNACSVDTTSSDQVSQDEIHQNYSLRYDEEDQTISSRATYRIGGPTGTTVKLEAPSRVTFNGTELDHRNFLGTYYTTVSKGPILGNYEWTYTDNNNKVYTNVVTAGTIDLTTNINRVRFGRDLIINYSAASLEAGERVGGSLRSAERSISAEPYGSGGSLRFKSEDIAKLPAGNVKLGLSRSKQLNLQNATKEGGGIYFEYLTKDVVLTLD